MFRIIELHFADQGSSTFFKSLDALYKHFFDAYPDKFYHWKSHEFKWKSDNVFVVDDCTFTIMYVYVYEEN